MPETKRSIHQTLEQARYRAAYDLVSKTEKQMKKDFGSYASRVKGFPATIMNNGLGQALAFLAARKKINGAIGNAEYQLLDHLERWLTISDQNSNCGCFSPPYHQPYAEGKLLEAIREGNSRLYLRASLEALAFLNYLRRVAASLDDKKEKPYLDNTQASDAQGEGL